MSFNVNRNIDNNSYNQRYKFIKKLQKLKNKKSRKLEKIYLKLNQIEKYDEESFTEELKVRLKDHNENVLFLNSLPKNRISDIQEHKRVERLHLDSNIESKRLEEDLKKYITEDYIKFQSLYLTKKLLLEEEIKEISNILNNIQNNAN